MMRLMLGTKDYPSLLVRVKEEYNPEHFEFHVINGRWDGTFHNGHVTIWHPNEPWTDLDTTEILTDNQDRLRGDYNDVFNNFDNPNYVAPERDKYFVPPASWDDDIPF